MEVKTLTLFIKLFCILSKKKGIIINYFIYNLGFISFQQFHWLNSPLQLELHYN